MSCFLPKYSKIYFENQKGYRAIGIASSAFLAFIFGLITILDKYKQQFILNWFYVSIAVLVYFLLLHNIRMDYRKKRGYSFGEEGVTVIGGNGKERRMIPYSELENAAARRQIHAKGKGLVIGWGTKKLCFFYEPGDEEAQKQVRKCYAMLQNHITTQLPRFRKTGQDLLDRRFFYKRSRRNQTILLAIGTFLIWVVCQEGSGADPFTIMFLAICIGICECANLVILYKSAVFGQSNCMKLKKEFEGDERIRCGNPYFGKIYFAVIAVFTFVFNFSMILSV